MKKILTLILSAVLLTGTAVGLSAQEKVFQFGIKAGLDFTNMNETTQITKDFLKTYTGFNAGLVFRFNLPLGFELQPEILYVQSGVKNVEAKTRGDFPSFEQIETSFKSGSLRVPVNIQWGFRFFRVIKPYVVLSPYVGCALFNNGKFLGYDLSTEQLRKFEYGLGIGAGINIWKLQLSFKWNWALNPTFNSRVDAEAIASQMKKSKMNGGELSLAFYF